MSGWKKFIFKQGGWFLVICLVGTGIIKTIFSDDFQKMLKNYGWTKTIIILTIIIAAYIIINWLWNKLRPEIKILTPMDLSLTKENSATFVFRNFYKIKSIDGKAVNWRVSVSKAASILIPSGQHTITFNYKKKELIELIAGGGTVGSNLTAQGIIEAGKTYFLASKDTQFKRDKKILSFVFVECREDDLKLYLKSFDDDLPDIELIDDNITNDNVQQFMNNYYNKLLLQGYKYLDTRENGNQEITGKLYAEFYQFGLNLKPGAIYRYSKPHYILLVSRGELGVMVGFSDL